MIAGMNLTAGETRLFSQFHTSETEPPIRCPTSFWRSFRSRRRFRRWFPRVCNTEKAEETEGVCYPRKSTKGVCFLTKFAELGGFRYSKGGVSSLDRALFY